VFSRFFIDRPIFASVLSIFITLAGGLAYFTLPLAQFPSVTPPTIQVDCTYPGASARVVAETVAAPIEQQVNGVERMLYMASQSNNDGTYSLTITFENGVNLNMAQVMVQNRVNLAMPLLPDVVKQIGVTTRKRSPDILQVINIYSEDPVTKKPVYDQNYLSNYTLIQIKDEIARVDGVGDMFMFGQRDYSMRLWIDPDKLAARSLTAGDIVRAIREQNVAVAAGQIGQPPSASGQQLQFTLTTTGRLSDPEQFKNVIVKIMPDGKVVRMRDVAKVEMNAKNSDLTVRVDGRSSVGLVTFQLPDANALETARRVIDKMEELKKSFPPGLDYQVSYETTSYTEESLSEVYKTLLDAVILVALVVMLFLQNWRSALIPLAAVPVAIIGTFAVMAAFGFSLNTLTLFGMVLAIGIVVDDAIVVVEAVERQLEHGLPPREATIRAMDQVAGPVVAVGLVLSAVFVPCAFISGLTGQFFRQFALTIASSTVLSAFNSLTLSPALTALLLKPHDPEKAEALPRPVFLLLGAWFGWFGTAWLMGLVKGYAVRRDYGTLLASCEALETWWTSLWADYPAWLPRLIATVLFSTLAWFASRRLNRCVLALFYYFNRLFQLCIRGYTWSVGRLLKASPITLAAYGGLLTLTLWSFGQLPRGFIPQQDMGYLIMSVQLPDSASDERTRDVMIQVEKIVHDTPGIQHVSAASGQSFALGASGSNFGSAFVLFDKFEDRQKPDLYSDGIINKLREKFAKEVSDASVVVFPPPPIRGVGRAGGFKFMVEDRGDVGTEMLQEEAQNLIDRAGVTEKDWAFYQAGLKGEADYKKIEADAKENKQAPTRQKEGWPVYKLSDDAFARLLHEDIPPAIVAALQPLKDLVVLKRYEEDFVQRLSQYLSAEQLGQYRTKILKNAEMPVPPAPKITGLFTVSRINVPQLFVDVDRKECMTMDVPVQDVFDALQVYMGSLYINDFNRFGRTWQVIAQADPRFRVDEKKVSRLQVRNRQGQMVQLGSMAKVTPINGPLVLYRYNMYPAVPLNGSAAAGVSSGQGNDAMRALARELPNNMSGEWTEVAFLEEQAGNTAMYLFGYAVVMVFLVLAAQYESWTLPLAVILVVPMCLLSALAGVWIAKMDINIFTQIGFVVLVGLASKNAILIVEFARQRLQEGMSVYEAALAACQLRLRPIIMTSFAFILGVVPLLTGHGAGAEMRRTLGTAVFAGMLGVTLFGIFLTPVFFYVIEKLSEAHLLRSPQLAAANRMALRIMHGALIIGSLGTVYLFTRKK
jgi:multidrug efflux pump